ncbi:MAG: hypothetical protein ACLFQX_00265 [Candidatus Kapaibacterium sp.]
MTDKELIEYIDQQAAAKDFVEFDRESFAALTQAQAQMLTDVYGHSTFMKLPPQEIEFFEWLLREDPEVWKDLWEAEGERPYIVGMGLLPALKRDNGRGFPICDLLENDNYYFAPAHLADKESRIFVESVRERFAAKRKLSTSQLLALEISFEAIDIWRFAYKHRIELAEAKRAARALAEDKIIVHLTEAEHLANFVEI